MNRKPLLQQAISALTRCIELPETQRDEDRTYQEVIKILMRMLQEYSQDQQQPTLPQMAQSTEVNPTMQKIQASI